MSDLKYELKKLIIEECEKDCKIEDIKDDEPLFGPDSILELDSMDALQISMAIQKSKYDGTDEKFGELIMRMGNEVSDKKGVE